MEMINFGVKILFCSMHVYIMPRHLKYSPFFNILNMCNLMWTMKYNDETKGGLEGKKRRREVPLALYM